MGRTKRPLTPKEHATLDAIVDMAKGLGRPPTLRELADRMGWRSLGTAGDYAARLEAKGYIERSGAGRRPGMRLVSAGPCPLCGRSA